MHRLVFFTLLFSLVSASACVRIEQETRLISRVAPLKNTVLKSATLDESRFIIRVYKDALDDGEYQRAQDAVHAILFAALAERENDPSLLALPHNLSKQELTLRVERCTLDALASRKNTVFRATCRLSLLAKGALLTESSASFTRIGGAKSVTEKRAKEIAKKIRNPLLAYEESEKALTGAALLALETLLSGRAVTEKKDKTSSKSASAESLRTSALGRLARDDISHDERASAIIDLGQSGRPGDALHLFGYLESQNPLVQLSAANAIAQLCPSSKAGIEALDAVIAKSDERLRALLDKAKSCAQVFATP